MKSPGQRIIDEIAEERKELQLSALLTSLTAIGLITAVLADWLGGPVVLVIGAYLLAYAAGGVPAAKDAIMELWQGRLDINLLMVLAALAAAAVGEVRDGAILLLLFSLASTLEGYAMGNTKRSIASLLELRPDQARRLDGSNEETLVPVETLAIDDVIVVRPGERIPIDAVIVRGDGAIDESSVTGESVPVDKGVGDQVYAGTLNQNVVLTLRVTTLAHQSTLARMIELVTEAREARSPSERFSNWFGERYTIAVLLGSAAALGIFVLLGIPFGDAAYKAATLLVVASPCAIVISVPAAVLSALSVAARNGVLFKGGAALEDFGNVTAMAFDKTGTLTHGEMRVAEVTAWGSEKERVLAVARTVEAASDHPIAKSIVEYVTTHAIAPYAVERTETFAGKGVVATAADGTAAYWVGNRAMAIHQGATLSTEAEAVLVEYETAGQTTVLVGQDATVLGVLALADTPRETAESVLTSLRSFGIKHVVMLTGDTLVVARAIGTRLGFIQSDIHGALLPADKVAIVQQLAATERVAFVGDGVNDAAALATANVGIAMGAAGSDVAIEAADVALLSNDLQKLAFTYELSRATNRIIKQNLIFAIGIMVLMVVVTTFWYLPLPLGVIGHEGGTLLVVANSLRLLLVRPK